MPLKENRAGSLLITQLNKTCLLNSRNILNRKQTFYTMRKYRSQLIFEKLQYAYPQALK